MPLRLAYERELRGSDDLKQRLSDPESILVDAGRALLAGVEEAFATEGPGWAPLAPGTVKERRRKGFGPAHPIQHRTGGYRRSWKADIDGDTLTIESADFRARILSKPGKNRPARPVEIPADAEDAAIEAIERRLMGE